MLVKPAGQFLKLLGLREKKTPKNKKQKPTL
jgi:hypothetical protein